MATKQQIERMMDDAFGITVPKPFKQLVWMAAKYGGSDGFHDFFGVIFEFGSAVVLKGTRRNPPSSGYLLTPPEFLTFGGPGMDGIHYGFVVHAPELRQADHPLGELQPIGGDGRGVRRLGDDTRTGLEFLMSRVLSGWADDPDPHEDVAFDRGKARSDIEEIAAAIGAEPTAAKGARPPDRITPTVPPGWHHVPTADGVGVLARQGAFADRPPLVGEGQEAIDDAWAMIRAGHPATALWGIRETFWQDHTSYDAFKALKPVWTSAYNELGRPLLAEALEWKRLT